MATFLRWLRFHLRRDTLLYAISCLTSVTLLTASARSTAVAHGKSVDESRPIETRKMKVCVIGAGAAGLCALRHLTKDSKTFEPVAFEQADDVGGTWIYNERTGQDDHGIPIHSSMYRDLRTNLPGQIMDFPDYRKLGRDNRGSISHREVLAYLRNYTEQFQLRPFIRFNARVETVIPASPSEDGRERWSVRIRDLSTGRSEEGEFNAVVICNGHYFEPYEPSISGLGDFPGQILHSHSYRKPEDFSNRTVVILGASSSGIDIGIELAGYSRHVYLSHNRDRLIGDLPPNLTQVYGLESVEGNRFNFKNGITATADTFMYCTGYLYKFPFLHESCGIRVRDENYVEPLYKQLINVEHPSMCIVGVPSQVVPFPLFHVQVQYFLALLKGKAQLPPKAEMSVDAKPKTPLKRHAHVLGQKQWEYVDSLAKAGGFELLPPFYKAGYLAWNEQRATNLLHYKDKKIIISEDGESVQILDN